MAQKEHSRPRKESPLPETEAWYRAVFSALNEGIVVFDAAGIAVDCNEGAARILGTTQAKLLGSQIRSSDGLTIRTDGTPFPSDQYPVIVALRTGQASDNVVLGINRAGQNVLWLSINARPIRHEGEALPRVVSSFFDVTARVEAEMSARRSEFLARASQALASSLDYETTLQTVASLAVPDLGDWCFVDVAEEDGGFTRFGVGHADPSHAVLAERFRRRYGPARAGVSGVSSVIADGKTLIVHDVTDAMLIGMARDDDHLEALRALGMRSYVCVPLAARGHILGAVLFASRRAIASAPSDRAGRTFNAADLKVVEDLAQRAGLAIEHARLYREAQEANRLKDQFLATISHELRTPLNAILGWAHMLRNEELDAQTIEKGLATIERSARTQGRLVEDLLDVSRITSGKLGLSLTPVDVRSVVKDAVDTTRPAAVAKGVRLESVLDAAPVIVQGDAGRLQQVVWNLLTNAIKFTPAGGLVTARVGRRDDVASISVSDTGQGVPAAFLPHLFERFRQADSSSTRPQGGLGIGLALARHIVELHGGSVQAESPGLGKGATFVVLLPTSDALAEPSAGYVRATSDDAEPRAPLRDLHVLLVDDDPDVRDLVAAILEDAGAKVTGAASATAALAAVSRQAPDVIISDIAMPGEDGYALIAKLRALPVTRATPAIALTAFARNEDRNRALSSGFQVHLAKPVDPDQLVAIVRTTAAKRSR